VSQNIRDQTSERRSSQRRSTQRQQLSAASSERHVNSAPLQLSADVNSAPFFVVPICSTQRHVNSALIELSAASTQKFNQIDNKLI
jgi:hypothetical protein